MPGQDTGGMAGRVYWEYRCGVGWRPVVLLLRGPWTRGAVRNVLILRDGRRVVRPFRGLRRQPPAQVTERGGRS